MTLQNEPINKPESSTSSRSGLGASDSNSSKQNYAVMPSFFYLSLKAMQDGSNIWLEQQKNSLEAEQELQLTMIGGQQSADGTWTIDPSKGFIQSIVDADIAMGEDDKKVALAESTSYIAQAATNGAAAGFTGGMGVRDSVKISSINKEIQSTQNFSDELNKPRAEGTALGNIKNEVSDNEADKLIEDWKDGKKLNIENFSPTAAAKLGNTSVEGKANLKAVKTAIKEKIEGHQNEINKISQDGGNRLRYAEMGMGIVNNSVGAATAVQKAEAQEKKGKDTAAASVFQTVQQTASSQIDKLREDSKQYAQNAEQQIMTIGQLTPARG